MNIVFPHRASGSVGFGVLGVLASVLVACSSASSDAPSESVDAASALLDGGPAVPSGAGASGTQGNAATGAPAGTSGAGPSPSVLAAPVAELAGEAASRSPGTQFGIAVRDLATGEYAAANDLERHVSASSPKAIWVAAALAKGGMTAMKPYAQPIFRDSDNVAAGSAIDLAGGIDAVNVFYTAKAKMVDSAMAQWSTGGINRFATNSPRKMGSDNYFTAKDAVSFLTLFEQGALLGPPETDQLRTWMTWSPRTGYAGWLGTLLPAPAQASMMHKSGWLPPGCCGDDAGYNILNEIGLVEVAPGHRYAIAILAAHGDDWSGKQAPFVERASCVIYRAVAGLPKTALDCND